MKEYLTLTHTFAPVYTEDSKILILGTFPSVRSRETAFYYGHKQNRFWRVLAALYGCPVPESKEEKISMLHAAKTAVWDVAARCDIVGSSDSSIKNVVPNDICALLAKTKIQRIYTNGGTAKKLYDKYQKPLCGIEAVQLPSTSPANAAVDLERLTEAWRVIL